METEEKKYPNEKKNLNPQTITTYLSGNWRYLIFDTCIMAITCTSGIGATKAEMFTCWWPRSQMLIVTYEVLVYNLDYWDQFIQ